MTNTPPYYQVQENTFKFAGVLFDNNIIASNSDLFHTKDW